jgi:hypothetical protein
MESSPIREKIATEHVTKALAIHNFIPVPSKMQKTNPNIRLKEQTTAGYSPSREH